MCIVPPPSLLPFLIFFGKHAHLKNLGQQFKYKYQPTYYFLLECMGFLELSLQASLQKDWAGIYNQVSTSWDIQVSINHRLRKGGLYSTSQHGRINLNVNSLNLPSLPLGIALVGGCWMILKFKSSCKGWWTSHHTKSSALDSITFSLYFVSSGAPQAPVSSGQVKRPLDPLYHNV